ncbi:MAG: DMT family transporter [Spirochaetes bacterium]|nr:DMT family transporter [Spirochaetota bacterium]
MSNDTRTHHPLSVISLVVTAVLWSSGGVLIKLIDWNPLAIAGMRSAVAAALIMIVVRKPKFHFSPVQIGGAISFSATVICFVSATKLTTAANAILLQYTAPVYTALFAWRFLGERTSWVDWATIAVVFGGVTLFFLDDLSRGGYIGNILALLAGVAHAWLGLFLRKQKDASPYESILLGNMLTAVIGLPFMLGASLSILDWTGLALLGVFQLGFSYILYAYAIKRVRALDAMLIFMIEPILSPIWVFLVVGESPGRWAIVGGAVVIISVTIRSIHALGGSGRLS